MPKQPLQTTLSLESFDWSDVEQLTLHKRAIDDADPSAGYQYVARAILRVSYLDGDGKRQTITQCGYEWTPAQGLVTALMAQAQFNDAAKRFAASLNGTEPA